MRKVSSYMCREQPCKDLLDWFLGPAESESDAQLEFWVMKLGTHRLLRFADCFVSISGCVPDNPADTVSEPCMPHSSPLSADALLFFLDRAISSKRA